MLQISWWHAFSEWGLKVAKDLLKKTYQLPRLIELINEKTNTIFQ
jgi:hypothetical protein